MKISEQTSFEGYPALSKANMLEDIVKCLYFWSGLQNNNNNEYYFNLGTGSYNNNNKNNTNYVIPVEPREVCDLVFKADGDCWKNKHSSWEANRYVYHEGSALVDLIYQLISGTYKPTTSICFIVMYPRPREVFAAHYQDRIAHHIVAPYITAVADAVHKYNGNVSFGNRKGVSAYHACKRLQENMRKHPNGYVASFDIKGCFMSVDKDIMWQVFTDYEKRFRPPYDDATIAFYRWLLHLLIMHNPSTDCERHSPIELWNEIPQDKSLFNRGNKGLPIGNVYSQLLIAVLLAVVCERLRGYDVVEFVDDFAIVVDSASEYKDVKRIFDDAMKDIKMVRHPHKCYIQPVEHGVKWCGYVVRPNRMYVTNRVIKNFESKLNGDYRTPTIGNAYKLQATFNSYIGMMCHANEWNTQCRFADMVAKIGYDKYCYFSEVYNKKVLRIRKVYTRNTRCENDLREIQITLFNYKHKISMIIIPVAKDAKHYERQFNKFIYRYGYEPIEGDEDSVRAVYEESAFRYKEPIIRAKVTAYCASKGIENEYKPEDYGY